MRPHRIRAGGPTGAVMPEDREEMDALLAEVSALADEAVADLGDASLAPSEADSASGVRASGSAAGACPGTGNPRPRAQAGPVVAAGCARPDPSGAADSIKRILNIEVPVIVRLATTTMPLSEILALSTGAIIEFDKPSDSLLHLMINNKCIGQGQAVKVGENFGLRVTSTGTVRDRIEAMGAP